MSPPKFYFLVSVQRYQYLNNEEIKDLDWILQTYPSLQISYVEKIETNTSPRYYSCLIDGFCQIYSGKRIPKFRIELPGNPMLGDGKSDNQNTASVFVRGEVVQLIDANQDHYFEEALKIRNVLSMLEFSKRDFQHPVAIVGAREHIFSEGFGCLGDLSAGKESTFGTLTQRILVRLGARMHYGHPDFLNWVFMMTRGGVSKGTKSLHLNEDIYAGYTAFLRGGRIKHTESFQCGKGRDLGFSSILSFVTKIAGGMGEQILSREQHRIGKYLPLHRMLSFYYSHTGFHVNNIFCMLSIRLFITGLFFASVLVFGSSTCVVNLGTQIENCDQLAVIFDWIKGKLSFFIVESMIAIILVMALGYIPFIVQIFSEFGPFYCLERVAKHLMSLSPVFEIFSTWIYCKYAKL